MKSIAVTGGKGGTGKSTVATALAVELGKKHKVLLADMDVDCPNDHLLLGIKRENLKEVFQRIPKIDSGKCTSCGKCSKVCKQNALVSIKKKEPIFIPAQCNGCGSCKIVCPANAISWDEKKIGKIYRGSGHGIDFISGELKINEPLSELVVGAVKGEISKIKAGYDFIILDSSAGTHCDVISALKGCDLALAVTEPTPLGVHDLGLILELLEILEVPSDVILNRFEEGREQLVVEKLKESGKKISAKIPYSREIMESYSKGIPIRDKSIEKIAEMVKA